MIKLFCSIGAPSDLAKAFHDWQTFISTPAVLSDRAFNSVITVTNSVVLVQGTRLGTSGELQASGAYLHLKRLGNLEIKQLEWLASVLASVEDHLEKIGGGIVSYFLFRRSCSVSDLVMLLLAHPIICEESRRQAIPPSNPGDNQQVVRQHQCFCSP